MRHISRDTFSDPHFGAWAIEFRLLWIGMLVAGTDDQGRMDDNPALIAAAIFPYDQQINAQIVELGLTLFAKQHKIMRYIAGGNGTGRKLIQILNWWRYQKSAQWAAVSHFPAPRQWVDRVRTHEGTQIVMINWDKPGGFDRSRSLRRANAGAMKHQRSASAGPAKAIDDSEVEARGRERGRDDKTYLPPTPSRAATRTAGRQEQQTTEEIEYPIITTIEKILTAASLENSKTRSSVSELVATRNLTDAIDEVLAALAAAYADDRVRDPAAVAAHSLETGTVKAAFKDPKTWKSLPKEVLVAAGYADMDDVRRVQAKKKIKAFLD